MWTEVSSPVPHFLQVGLLPSPVMHKFLLNVLCPVIRSITILVWVLIKDNNRALVAGSGPETNSRACLYVLQGPIHAMSLTHSQWDSRSRVYSLLDESLKLHETLRTFPPYFSSIVFISYLLRSQSTYILEQCFSTTRPRPGTGTWHQLYRAARGSPGICHFSFLSNFH